MKRIAIVWTITLLIIVAGLTVIGFKIKKDNIGDLSEDALVEQTKKYLGYYTNLYPTKGKSITLTYEKLKDEGYDAKLEDDCTGYVVIENTDMGFTYKAYVDCPEYRTKGYSEE